MKKLYGEMKYLTLVIMLHEGSRYLITACAGINESAQPAAQESHYSTSGADEISLIGGKQVLFFLTRLNRLQNLSGKCE